LKTVGWILNILPRFDGVMRGVPNNFATGSLETGRALLAFRSAGDGVSLV
jgi:hypothetical protein